MASLGSSKQRSPSFVSEPFSESQSEQQRPKQALNLPEGFAEYEFDNSIGLLFGVLDQSAATEQTRLDFIALADELFDGLSDGFLQDQENQRQFVDLAEKARGLPVQAPVSDTDIKKIIKIFETIIISNNGVSPNGGQKRNPDLHYRGIREFFKYLRGEPRILLNFTPYTKVLQSYNLTPMAKSKNKFVT